MNEKFLLVEDNLNKDIKKLINIINNLSTNLSKDKTEKAIEDGHIFITLIEGGIEEIVKLDFENKFLSKIFTIKTEFKDLKSKFTQIEKNYIMKKGNEYLSRSLGTFDNNNTNITYLDRGDEVEMDNLEGRDETNLISNINYKNLNYPEKNDLVVDFQENEYDFLRLRISRNQCFIIFIVILTILVITCLLIYLFY